MGSCVPLSTSPACNTPLPVFCLPHPLTRRLLLLLLPTAPAHCSPDYYLLPFLFHHFSLLSALYASGFCAGCVFLPGTIFSMLLSRFSCPLFHSLAEVRRGRCHLSFRHMFTFFFQSLSSPQLFSVKASRPAGRIRVPLLLCGSPVNFPTTAHVPASGEPWGGPGGGWGEAGEMLRRWRGLTLLTCLHPLPFSLQTIHTHFTQTTCQHNIATRPPAAQKSTRPPPSRSQASQKRCVRNAITRPT